MQGLRTAASGLALALVAGAFISAGPAAASGPLTVLDFVGTCSDCSGTGRGVLTVQNFGTGILNESNFVDFTYSSDLVTFEIARSALFQFSADFSTLPGLAAVSIEEATSGPKGSDNQLHDFSSLLTPNTFDGSDWSVSGFIQAPGGVELPVAGGGVINDEGPSYVWRLDSAAPEPGVWTLMIAGFGLAGAGLRSARRRRAAATA
jgi:hypothetical protein